jgi:hypothetical protein
MNNNKKILSGSVVLGNGLLTSMMFASASQAAGFIDDAHGTFQTSNFYYSRDFRDGAGQSKREEWAQGFMLDLRSGYTQGTVGFGLDALGMLGVRLDSSPDRTGSGLLPVHDDGRAAGEYSKLGLTGKMKVSRSELKVGTLQFKMPLLVGNTGRILPQTFQGGVIDSKELDHFTFTAGSINRAVARDSTDNDALTLTNRNRRFVATPQADHFRFGGVDYAFSPTLNLTYQAAELEDIYRQHYLGLVHTLPLGPGKLKTDLRYFISDKSGAANAGDIDNRSFNGILTYSLQGHALGVSYQSLTGRTAMPYVGGADVYTSNFALVGDFVERNERTWQLRYDFDFATVGLPGLTVMTRYIAGNDADVLTHDGNGSEWERNSEIGYSVQSGVLKNVGVRWRNSTYRSNFTRGVDENRLIISYSLPLF